MKTCFAPFLLFMAFVIVNGCTGKSSARKETPAEAGVASVPDTGYTGIKQYFSSERLMKEATFKNGVREGLMKTYYPGGQLYQTFWYEKGLREDSSAWYYLEGQIFRTTPYKHDTIDGIQRQYYRTGKLRAKIGYSKGLRTPFLEEYNPNGKLSGGYPEIVTEIRDEYNSKGLYRINLSMSDKTTKVKFYRGEFTDGRFDTTLVKKLNVVNGKSSLDLKKTNTSRPGYVGVIAEIITQFGNRHLIYKKIDLPYKDLN
jgi:antitoxin component YwqK of YwqJK toxin-antitoxin module